MLDQTQLKKQLESLSQTVKEKEEIDRTLSMMKSFSGPEEVISSEEYLKAVKKLRGDEKLLRVSSGIKGLDSLVESFNEGEVVVVSGPTKEGKTTFCQTLTLRLFETGVGILWLPFDTPGEELIGRFEKPVKFYLPRRNKNQKTVEWVEEKIIEGIAKYNTRVVFIDHLGMLTRYTNSRDNRATELQSLMTDLKNIAIRWRVIIFVNHHIRRRMSEDSPPGLEDLKDSSGVAQDADTVLFVWRMKKKTEFGWDYSDVSMLSLQAHRRSGRRGFVKLKHHGDHFEEFFPSDKETISDITGKL